MYILIMLLMFFVAVENVYFVDGDVYFANTMKQEQYVFIHDVLLEWLKAGNTKVPACELRQYTDRMTLPDEHGKVLLNDHYKVSCNSRIETPIISQPHPHRFLNNYINVKGICLICKVGSNY